MNSINIIGNLGKDPEMTYTPAGVAITKFSVADQLPAKKGQERSETQWYNCTLFGKQAESFAQHGKKGGKVYVVGAFEARKWTGKDGVEHTSLDVTVDKYMLLDSRPVTKAEQPQDDGVPADFPF